ncbi:hypothetical protein B0H12DRAFT_1143858 [Mycena haematopus]|nr:hypothetical protein B0H12DRAFT_1143858 [Mycena haematopus]
MLLSSCALLVFFIVFAFLSLLQPLSSICGQAPTKRLSLPPIANRTPPFQLLPATRRLLITCTC